MDGWQSTTQQSARCQYGIGPYQPAAEADAAAVSSFIIIAIIVYEWMSHLSA